MFKYHTLQMDSKKLAINFNFLIVEVVDTYTTKVLGLNFLEVLILAWIIAKNISRFELLLILLLCFFKSLQL